MRPQAVFEPHFLDFEIELQSLDLLRKRHLGRRFIDQSVTEKGREPREHRVRALGLLQQHQCRDRVQGIEQEVRVELVSQHRQLSARSLALEPLALVDLLFQQQEIVDSVIERRPSGEQREIEQDRTEILDSDRPPDRATSRHVRSWHSNC